MFDIDKNYLISNLERMYHSGLMGIINLYFTIFYLYFNYLFNFKGTPSLFPLFVTQLYPYPKYF